MMAQTYTERNYGCRVETEGTFKGMRTIVIQNEYIRLSLLLDKGSDIYELLYKPKDTDFLWRSPIGIRNPIRGPTFETSYESFMGNYHGGWQEVFPSGSGSSIYKGGTTGYHGEVAYTQWGHEVTINDPDTVEVMLKTKTIRTPFILEKRIRLESGKPVVFIEEKIINYGNSDLSFMWGHHPSFGAPFLSKDCILSLPPCEVITQPETMPNTRFPAGCKFNWPWAIDVQQKKVDLRKIPDSSIHCSDMLYARNLKEGWYAITNRQSGIGIGMVWPVEMFPYIWVWQEFGGTEGFPWYGNAYTMAVEPFTSIPEKGENGLIEAMKNGTAEWIASHQAIKKEFKVVVFETDADVKRINESGTVEFNETVKEEH
jgi:hypothetical protein